jgi:thiamine pyrophosphate-dependent acetolactate synthase large subunit-like protein
MAAAVHSNVGLMHATMAVFNAWCDRMPLIILGATGPLDASKRRPWIDWIHTARDQGAIVRHYTKWDDQPSSPAAAQESLLRAAWIASTEPMGPVYINLDAEMQEAKLTEEVPPLEVARFMPTMQSAAPSDLIAKAADILSAAKHPIILAGRASRNLDAWNARVALAESLRAKVFTDLKIGASFPTEHSLHGGAPRLIPRAELAQADAILSLDWVDLGGALQSVGPSPPAKIIQVSLDHRLHNGWSMDYQALPPVDLFLPAHPDVVVPELLNALGARARSTGPTTSAKPDAPLPAGTLSNEHLARALRRALGDRTASLVHLPLSWDENWWPFRHPLDFIGSDAGGGVGGGPGIAVGAALALKGSGRLPIAICGDGDFLMGVTALWTAVHYRIPLLVAVANNRSFYNDEVHQERVALARKRPVENKWIGQRMSDPEIDLAGMARAQGAQGFGPITTASELAAAFAQAIEAVENGGVAVVDVRVEPSYTAATVSGMTRLKG